LLTHPFAWNSQFGVALHFPRFFLREGAPSARTTICMNARQTSPLSKPAPLCISSRLVCYHTGCRCSIVWRREWKGLSRSNRNGPRGGENRWVSCLWPEPTLPQKAREGWGNPVRNYDSEGMGQPPRTFALEEDATRYEKNGRYLIKDAEGLIRSFGAVRDPI
jgi:hypothetical protein